jgi:hypothetical protein
VQPKRVERVFVSQGLKHLVEVKAGADTISATYNYPFWVHEEHQFEWTNQLKPGDHLWMPDGKTLVVESIRFRDQVLPVYNLAINNVHTFFVGNQPVLGHNTCGRLIAGTRGLLHSFDRHAALWFGRDVAASGDMAAWQSLIESASASSQTFEWSLRGSPTVGHLARIEGKWLVTQFYITGPIAGGLATAFVPNQAELGVILGRI